MPTQMPEHRAAAGQPHGRSAGRRRPRAARACTRRSADARHEQAVGGQRRLRGRRSASTSAPTRSSARTAERTLPDAVVEHHDAGRHRAPPPSRPAGGASSCHRARRTGATCWLPRLDQPVAVHGRAAGPAVQRGRAARQPERVAAGRPATRYASPAGSRRASTSRRAVAERSAPAVRARSPGRPAARPLRCGPPRAAAPTPASAARPASRRACIVHHGVAADGEQPDRRPQPAAAPAGRPAPASASSYGAVPPGRVRPAAATVHAVARARRRTGTEPAPAHAATASARPRVHQHAAARAGRAATAPHGCYRLPFVLGTPDDARVERDRVAQRPGDRLELRLDEVVRVAAGQHPDVQRDAGVVGEASRRRAGSASRRRSPPMTTYDLALRLARVHAVGAAGQVDDGLDQRLVERHGRVAEPADAAPCRRAPRAAPGRATIAVSSTVWWASMCDVAVGA